MLAAIREGLPALGAGIYLNTAAAGPLPAETARAMAEIAAVELTYGRGHVHDPFETAERVGEARAAVAAVLAADLAAVALTQGTAHGIALAIAAAGVQAQARVICGADSGPRLAHGGWAGWPLGMLPALGAEIVPVPLAGIRATSDIVAAFDAALAGGAGLVILPHVLETSGRVLPVADIADLARGRGALVVVDGSQSVGAIPVAPDLLGADALAFSAERWLLGPAGLGALWCGPRMLDRSRTLFPGGFVDALTGPASTGAPGSRETPPWAGTDAWNRPSVVGMARSCGWLSMHVGLEWAWARSAELARRAAAALASIERVAVLSPLDELATIVTFRIAGWPAATALDELGARVFAIAGVVPALDAIRISLAAFNSEDEVGRFIDGVALLAGHTPASVPPRRTLNVLP